MKRTKQLLKLSNAAAVKGKALQRKLVNRWPVQSDAQSDIEHTALNIIYLL